MESKTAGSRHPQSYPLGQGKHVGSQYMVAYTLCYQIIKIHKYPNSEPQYSQAPGRSWGLKTLTKFPDPTFYPHREVRKMAKKSEKCF